MKYDYSKPGIRAEIKKAEILAAAVALSERVGYRIITRDAIAIEAKCAQGSVLGHYSTMAILRRAIVGHAISTKNLKILAEAMSADDPRVAKMPQELRREVANYLVG
jgi:AcrR family transcriptional regulator